jgi:excisionase family DNA binding protein
MAPRQRKTTPNPMPDREILNIDGAAAFLGVSVKTFSKVLREGDVPGRKVGREWKFSRQALIDWVASGTSSDFYREQQPASGNGTTGATGAAEQPQRQQRPQARTRRTDGWRIEFD